MRPACRALPDAGRAARPAPSPVGTQGGGLVGYTTRSRDRYKTVVAMTTGLAAFASALAAGTATGVVARSAAAKAQAAEQRQSSATAQALAAWARSRQASTAPARTVVLTRPRPQRTVVHTRVVQEVS